MNLLKKLFAPEQKPKKRRRPARNGTRVLTIEEFHAVLSDLRERCQTGLPLVQTQLAVFRLCCCCGMRRSEVAKLKLRDVITDSSKPVIHIRDDVGKGGHERNIPLDWDEDVWNDLKVWKQYRINQGATPDSPFIAAVKHAPGTHVTGETIGKRWRQAIRVLGEDRVKQLASHCGRRTFCTQTLAYGRSLPEVRDAAGHANISTTNEYLYAVDTKAPSPFKVIS